MDFSSLLPVVCRDSFRGPSIQYMGSRLRKESSQENLMLQPFIYIRNNSQLWVFVSSTPRMAEVITNLTFWLSSLIFDFSENILSTFKARIAAHFELQLMNGT